jgi:zinc protease
MMRAFVAIAITLTLVGCGEPPEPLAPPPPPPAPADPKPAAGPAVDRSQLPAPDPVVVWAPPTPNVTTLSNGIRVWHAKWGELPVASLLVVIPRGSATDPKGKAGLAYLTADMFDEGAGKRSALELSEELQRLATDYSASASVDYTMLSMDLLAENFGPSVDLLADMVRRPRFDPAEFKRRKDYFIAQALASESDPRSAQDAAMANVLFADGYAGSVDEGTRTSLQAITATDVRNQYKNAITPDGVEFIVVGGIDQATVTKELERTFGDWKGQAKSKPRELAEASTESGIYVVDFPGAAQSVLSVVRRAEGAQTENYFPAMVFNRSFGEAFTSRLNLNLREDKGYTYGARSTFQRFRNVGYFALSAAVKSETTRASIDEMLKELKLACGTKPITARERDESVSGLLLGYPGRFETISGVGGSFASLAIFDRPVDWYQTWPRAVEGVTLATANKLAHEYCDPSQFSIVLAGDRAKLQETFSTLGRPVVAYDAQGKRTP